MIKIDTFKSLLIDNFKKEDLIQELIKAGVQFNEYAKTLFEYHFFSQAPKPERIELVKVTLSELNLEPPCSLEKAIESAATLKLKPCPLCVGAFLRLNYLDQPEGAYLTIASHRPKTNDNYPTGFYIRNFDNALWLRGYRSLGDSDWPPNNEFIFKK